MKITIQENQNALEPEIIVVCKELTSELEEILSGIANREVIRVIPDRAEAIRYAVQQGKRGDLILLAGKGHEEYEIVGEERRPFHERILVKEAFEARLRAPEGMGLTEGEQTNEGRDTK